MGRPSDFTQETADIICERLGDGESLRSICDTEGMPNKATVFRWLVANEPFRDQYARARETQADSLFDEILAIADDGHNDWMKRNHGEDERWVENGESLRRSQLRVDARKWMAGKLRPKKYGERITNEHVGEDGKPIEILNLTTADRARALAAFIDKTKAER